MKPHPYLIIVDGALRARDREWLADLEIGALQQNLTALSGTLDQSALHGVFKRLQHLALEVYEVHRLCACLGGKRSAAHALTVS
jgi:hypothetical protein